MFKLATALMGLFSASIFLAHAVDAYKGVYWLLDQMEGRITESI